MTEENKGTPLSWFKEKMNQTTDATQKAGQKLQEEAKKFEVQYQESSLKEAVDDTAQKTKSYLDESGISGHAAKLSTATTEQLDSVSGKKIMEELLHQKALQEDYNNILATKLEEALTRIARLEERCPPPGTGAGA